MEPDKAEKAWRESSQPRRGLTEEEFGKHVMGKCTYENCKNQTSSYVQITRDIDMLGEGGEQTKEQTESDIIPVLIENLHPQPASRMRINRRARRKTGRSWYNLG